MAGVTNAKVGLVDDAPAMNLWCNKREGRRRGGEERRKNIGYCSIAELTCKGDRWRGSGGEKSFQLHCRELDIQPAAGVEYVATIQRTFTLTRTAALITSCY